MTRLGRAIPLLGAKASRLTVAEGDEFIGAFVGKENDVASGEIMTIAVPGGLRVAFWCFRPLRPGALDRFDGVMRVCERLVSVASGSRKRDPTPDRTREIPPRQEGVL